MRSYSTWLYVNLPLEGVGERWANARPETFGARNTGKSHLTSVPKGGIAYEPNSQQRPK